MLITDPADPDNQNYYN
jgi:hypothetical protein